MFLCNSGSEANDTQVKLVWYLNNALGRPNKKKIISRIKAYHGVTIVAASLTGLPGNHRDFDLPLPGFLDTNCPHHYRFAHDGESEEDFATRLAAELEAMIVREGPDTVAAFIAEPVMGAGGVIVPPRTYFEKIGEVCARYDVFTISDEVICGFGRLGTNFGCEKLNFAPQSISVAKMLSSAYLPIAGVMIPETMYQALLIESKKIGVFGHGFTYGGHPVAAAVALKAIEIYARDRIVEGAATRGVRFQAHLKTLGEHPLVGEARGLGLIGGSTCRRQKLETLLRARSTALVARRAVRGGRRPYRARVLGDVLTLSPPLIISEAEIDDLFDRLDARRQNTRLGDA